MNTSYNVAANNSTRIKKLMIKISSKAIMVKFIETVENWFTKIKSNQKQICNLEVKLRDTLLPKLMSGEVRVGV